MPPTINKDLCTNCENCIEDCPGNVLGKSDEIPEVAFPDECWHCGVCRLSCPSGAISYRFPLHMLI